MILAFSLPAHPHPFHHLFTLHPIFRHVHGAYRRLPFCILRYSYGNDVDTSWRVTGAYPVSLSSAEFSRQSSGMTIVLWAVPMRRVDAPAPRERCVCLHALYIYIHTYARHAPAGKQTWNPKRALLQTAVLLNGSPLRFHVGLKVV